MSAVHPNGCVPSYLENDASAKEERLEAVFGHAPSSFVFEHYNLISSFLIPDWDYLHVAHVLPDRYVEMVNEIEIGKRTDGLQT